MNILLVSTGGHIGGEETFTKNLAMALLKRGHNVWVAPGGEVQRKNLIENNVPVADIDIRRRSIVGLYKGALNIRKFVKDNAIKIVHCQAAGPAIMGAIVKFMNWDRGEKWFYHGHGVNNLTYKWLPFILNKLDFSMVCSDYELTNFITNGVNSSKIVRVHNGIDPKEFGFDEDETYKNRREIRSSFGIPDSEFTIGYIGRLSPEKGCDLILPAFQTVLTENHSLRLLIVGDGILKESMQKMAGQYNFGNKVIFAGFRSDIPKILCSLDGLILPSYKDTFSLTSLQAMGAGIPVVASDAGGNPEQIVPRFNGYLFGIGNVKEFALRIIDLIRNNNSKKMGSNGRQLVEKYLNTSRMVDEIEFYYKNKS